MAPPGIVIVDDAADVRTLVKTALRLSRRFDVVAEAADGRAAVEAARIHRPALMLLDVSMPVMDGIEALPRVLEVSPQTRVVLYTGFDERILAERARSLGATAVVEKSVSLDELVERLATMLPDRPDAQPGAGGESQQVVPAADESALAEHLERFREVFEEATIGMATLTLSGRLVRANRALADLVSRPVDVLVGTAYADLMAGDTGSLAAAVRLLLGDGKVAQFEHDVAGVGRRVLTTLAAVRDSQGRALYLFLQMQDVSAQRGAEEQLRRSEERFRLLVEAVQDYAIFMLDPDGRIASWNAGAQRIKGYAADEIVGQHFRVFYPPDKQAERYPEQELEWALRDGSYEEEGWRIRKDGSRFWANVVITTVRDDDGNHLGFTKVTRDMTERRQLVERFERAAFEQAQFLAVTAHELRLPVSVLAGAADIVAKHWDDLTPDERADMAASMSGSAARLRRMLADLLTASRLQSGAVELDVEVVQLGPLLHEVAARARRAAPDAEIVVGGPDDVVVDADRDRLAQLFDNLVGNALRHGAPPVTLAMSVDASAISVRVSDAGPGVPEELRPRLFERFATGERKDGTGLGLFIVHELARAHGGDARYDGAAGSGGGFVVTLPLPGTIRTFPPNDSTHDRSVASK